MVVCAAQEFEFFVGVRRLRIAPCHPLLLKRRQTAEFDLLKQEVLVVAGSNLNGRDPGRGQESPLFIDRVSCPSFMHVFGGQSYLKQAYRESCMWIYGWGDAFCSLTSSMFEQDLAIPCARRGSGS